MSERRQRDGTDRRRRAAADIEGIPGRTGIDGDRRGQVVLLAGVLVALALITTLVAFLQLGYHADVETSGPDEQLTTEGQSFLQRATHDAARDLRGQFSWSERDRAVGALKDRLRLRIDTLERSGVDSGVVFEATYNHTVADTWAQEECPRGSARQFSRCRPDRGVVVQERDGRTLVLAVAYDLRVTTERSEIEVTTVVLTRG